MPTPMPGAKPEWLTFDCYGTLIQWDEGLLAAVDRILARREGEPVEAQALLKVYDAHEHALERDRPHRSFRTVAGEALRRALQHLDLSCDSADIETLTSAISAMPPFPEVVGALAALKRQGFKLCIISNTDDDIIAGNAAQLGGHIDRVVTAGQAQAYKPSALIFDHAHKSLGISRHEVVHICASPQLDHTAARDIGFRCVWIDRGTGRRLLPDYVPDQTFSTLDEVPVFFDAIGWGG